MHPLPAGHTPSTVVCVCGSIAKAVSRPQGTHLCPIRVTHQSRWPITRIALSRPFRQWVSFIFHNILQQVAAAGATGVKVELAQTNEDNSSSDDWTWDSFELSLKCIFFHKLAHSSAALHLAESFTPQSGEAEKDDQDKGNSDIPAVDEAAGSPSILMRRCTSNCGMW